MLWVLHPIPSAILLNGEVEQYLVDREALSLLYDQLDHQIQEFHLAQYHQEGQLDLEKKMKEHIINIKYCKHT